MGFFDVILQFIFPNHCILCNNIIQYNNIVCDKCQKLIPYTNNSDFTNRFFSTKDNPIYFDKCISPLFFEGEVARSIRNFKFNKKINFCRNFAKIMSISAYNHLNTNEIDYIIGVPMHKFDLQKRGYNQSELLAKRIAEELDLEIANKILRKHKKTNKQHNLNSKDRKNNLKDAFEITKKEFVLGKTFLLCDDVVTTSATINECSKTLKKAGAKKVYCISASIVIEK